MGAVRKASLGKRAQILGLVDVVKMYGPCTYADGLKSSSSTSCAMSTDMRLSRKPHTQVF